MFDLACLVKMRKLLKNNSRLRCLLCLSNYSLRIFFLEQSCQHEHILFHVREKAKPLMVLQRWFSFFLFHLPAISLRGNWKVFFMLLVLLLNEAAITEEQGAASWPLCFRPERYVSPSTPHPSCCLCYWSLKWTLMLTTTLFLLNQAWRGSSKSSLLCLAPVQCVNTVWG